MSVRLAVVGCGAIAEKFHLPALQRAAGAGTSLVFVDPSIDRARRLADACPGAGVAGDWRAVLDQVDALLLTLPHHLHHAVALEALSRKRHVLSEKPLATDHAEAAELVAMAAAQGVHLAVNNTRRLYPAHKKVAELVRSGALGRLTHLRFEDGDKFDWPLASPSLFGRAAGGRGIVLDIGAHVLDLVCWWLGGEPELVSYADDAMGGTEAHAEIRCARDGCTADVRLSWLGKLDNAFTLVGERGEVRGGIYDMNRLEVRRDGRTQVWTASNGPRMYGDLAQPLLEHFLEAVAGRGAPLVTGADVLPSIALIERCYASRARLDLPWFDAWTRIAS
ncbi:MAG: Gfo/Idh/MocA family oxidoreductase [Gemmatimonadaceae bacterium]|jgi:predicted dehydrogenase|nr:Gfo/Idh/MocA family oxidoreductase [Gemmatimonadaceae bacterium]